jgi:diketogulonate reductase-like aldo/keto reductase
MNISKYPIVVDQVSLNIFNRKPIEAGLLEYCISNDIAFQAYRPLAASLDQLESNNTVAAISKKRGITKAQVALAYILKKGANLTVSASSAKHWQEILAVAEDNPLTEGDIDIIEANIPSSPHPRTDYDDFIDAELN